MGVLKYILLVFFGACSYGVLSTIMKLGFMEGFTVNELIGGQYVFGWCFLLMLALISSRGKLGSRQWLRLTAVGMTISLTSIFYGLAVEKLPASVAVVFLFQFTWIGILLEAIVDRKIPARDTLLSVAVLFAGTLLASGIFEQEQGALSVMGVIFGLLSAVTFASYIFISGRAAVEEPPFTRSLFMVTGAMLLVFLVFSPEFLWNGSMQAGLWKYGAMLGLLGIAIPIGCFTIGVPKIGPSLGTILGAAELPAAIVVSVSILGENVSPGQWLGVAFILAGIVLPPVMRSRHHSRSTAA